MNAHKKRTYYTGFTLAEMAVALVILSLLVIGATTGKHLVHQSNVAKVSVELIRYKDLSRQFKDRYLALPGDFSNAESFWSDPGVDNGDGDGRINVNDNEDMQFWKHLTAADLLEADYTGDDEQYVIGVNIPKGPLNGTGYYIRFIAVVDHNGDIHQANWLSYFTALPGAILPIGPSLTQEEAFNVDSKIDDGRPFGGYLWSRTGAADSTGTPVTTPCSTGGIYDVSSNTRSCRLKFAIDEIYLY